MNFFQILVILSVLLLLVYVCATLYNLVVGNATSKSDTPAFNPDEEFPVPEVEADSDSESDV